MRDIGPDEGRRVRPQPPCARRVAAARCRPLRWRSSAISRIALVAPPCVQHRGARNAAPPITRTGS